MENWELQLEAVRQRINQRIDRQATEAKIIIEAKAIEAKKRITRRINYVFFKQIITERFPDAELSVGTSGFKFAVLQ